MVARNKSKIISSLIKYLLFVTLSLFVNETSSLIWKIIRFLLFKTTLESIVLSFRIYFNTFSD